MPTKPSPKVYRTTYSSPENQLQESYAEIVNNQAVYGQTTPTAEQAAGVNPSELSGQYIPPKPDSPTATIEPGLGAGKAEDPTTYPYPPNMDSSLGVPDHTLTAF